jgi:hypothetical protein
MRWSAVAPDVSHRFRLFAVLVFVANDGVGSSILAAGHSGSSTGVQRDLAASRPHLNRGSYLFGPIRRHEPAPSDR